MFDIVPTPTALDVHVLLKVPDPPVTFVVNRVVKPTHKSLAPIGAPAKGKGFTIIDNTDE